MGGECLNTGCVPSKALLAAAKATQTVRTISRFGIEAAEPRVDFAAVHRHVHEVIAAIAPHDSVERFEKFGVEVIRAEARFIGPRELIAGNRAISARRIVVATGSEPAIPPVPGIEAVPYLTNETIFENAVLPEHLLIVGAGAVGIELAQAYRRLGSRVTLIEAATAMPRDDAELVAALLQCLAAEEIAIHQHAAVKRAEPNGGGIALTVEHDGRESRLEGSHLLVAAGRKPRTADLDLERAGVRYGKDGIEVDRRLRTTAHGVYAIGDVIAEAPRLTHAGSYQAGIVIRNALFRLPAKVDYSALPWVTYTDPELAQVGLTEAEARRRYGADVAVSRFEFAENDRAQAERETVGTAKIVSRRNGRILGVHMVGPWVTEQLSEAFVAVNWEATVDDLASLIQPHPTMSEVLGEAMLSLTGRALHG